MVDVSEVTLIGVSELASTSTIRVFAQWTSANSGRNGGQLSGDGGIGIWGGGEGGICVFWGVGREGWKGGRGHVLLSDAWVSSWGLGGVLGEDFGGGMVEGGGCG